MTKQFGDKFKIRSVSTGGAWGSGPTQSSTEQSSEDYKIRSVSDGGAWGWGPARTEQ